MGRNSTHFAKKDEALQVSWISACVDFMVFKRLEVPSISTRHRVGRGYVDQRWKTAGLALVGATHVASHSHIPDPLQSTRQQTNVTHSPVRIRTTASFGPPATPLPADQFASRAAWRNASTLLLVQTFYVLGLAARRFRHFLALQAANSWRYCRGIVSAPPPLPAILRNMQFILS
jgi:hypothetical protein